MNIVHSQNAVNGGGRLRPPRTGQVTALAPGHPADLRPHHGLKITTTGSNGVGACTATCSGGMDFADLTAPPVKVNYTVAYGLSAFPAPANNATLARSAHSFAVTVKLGRISATPAAKLSAAGRIRAVLSGPGISPETVTLKWQPKTAEFTASMPIPAKVKTGQTYVITIKENIGTGLIPVPRLGPTVNPGNVTFK